MALEPTRRASFEEDDVPASYHRADFWKERKAMMQDHADGTGEFPTRFSYRGEYAACGLTTESVKLPGVAVKLRNEAKKKAGS